MKRIVSVFLILLLIISIISTSIVPINAAVYSASAAVEYASSHWNDGVGLCAEFVSNCLSAGGCSAWSKGAADLRSKLKTQGWGSEYVLTKSGSYLYQNSNVGKLSAGDPIFYYCSVCGTTVHTVICSGFDGNGRATAYAHNEPWNNVNYVAGFMDGNKHSGGSITIYSVHMNQGSVGSNVSYASIADGNYFVRNKYTNAYLNVSYSEDKDGTVIGTSKFGNYDAQVYHIYSVSNGYEMMPLCSSTRVVNPYGSTVKDGNAVNLYTKTGDGTQWWKFQAQDGGYIIRNVQNPNVCITMTDNGLKVMNYDGSSGQIWYLEKAVHISYNANGGSGAPSSERVRAGYASTVSATAPSRANYTFRGWSTTKTATTPDYAAGSTITISADTTLYAVWRLNATYQTIEPGRYFLKNKWTDSYLNVSHAADEDNTIVHTYKFENYGSQVFNIYEGVDGYEIMPLCSETRILTPDGRTAGGDEQVVIYTNIGSSSQRWKFQAYDGGYIIHNVKNLDQCMTATEWGWQKLSEYDEFEDQIWYLEKACNISYDANGGSDAPAAERVRGGYSSAVSSQVPSRENYTFKGWAVSQTAKAPDYVAGSTITVSDDTILYAVWEESYTLQPINPGNYFVRNKYTNKYLNVNYSIDENGTLMGTSFYGNFDVQVYHIYSVADGYEMMPLCSSTRVVNPYGATVTDGEEVNLWSKTNDERQWWKFQAKDGGYIIRNVSNPSLCLNMTDNGLKVTYYDGSSGQIWYLEKAVNINYDANGGSNAPSSQRVRAGYGATLSSQEPTREGYTFAGWATSANAENAQYGTGVDVSVMETTTFYAIWEEAVLPGDSNGDGTIDMSDVVTIMRGVSGTMSEQYVAENSDYNQNGTVDMTDVVALLIALAG